MSSSKVLFERSGAVATIRPNDPKTPNALSADMALAVLEGAKEGEASARARVLCGAAKAFSSGANLASGFGLESLGPDFDAGQGLETAINPLMLALRDLRILWVSAVCGLAAGVGGALALAADLIVAGETAYFLQAFRRIGLVPDGGSTYLLARAIGRPRAMEMMLLGEKVSAARAYDWGMINRVTIDEDVEPTAFAHADALARGPTRALGPIRRAAWRATDGDFETALKTERESQREAGRSQTSRRACAPSWKSAPRASRAND